MSEVEFSIEAAAPRLHCMRCNYATYSVGSMRAHILDRQCPQKAQAYYERFAQ